ncbi:MAG TPA: 3-oxoadipate enol-lactonase [Xanthobacteraceae bacterium]|jgi:3-oxoadipate enol-lactonase|nr:3-oxoadipate enol-lactonase [Xanthobacteraceae bacterium]
MPMIAAADGCPLWVEFEGPPQAPVLVLSNSLGTDLHMWDAQAALFAQSFRVVRYDRRGHGKSGVPHGPYTMEQLARDALAIADALGLGRFHWCGLSMGGMEGMWLAAHAAARLDRLILSNTCCFYPDKPVWDRRIAAVRSVGDLSLLADWILRLWFSPRFLTGAGAAAVTPFRSMLSATQIEGYIGCCEAIRDMDHRDILPHIHAPTLVIAGRYDQATPVAAAKLIHSRIRDAGLEIFDSGHFTNVEQPEAYARLVLDFLRCPT